MENKKTKNENYVIDYENLALPEIHTGQVEPDSAPEPEEEISYDTLAIPEIHVRRKKK